MRLTLDPDSAVAPYDQVRRGIIDLVQTGTLVAGSKLPTVRALADELGLAVNTVARAYRELESEGVIETRGRNGSFILASGDSIRRSIETAARQYADLAAQLQVSREEALAIVAAALTA